MPYEIIAPAALWAVAGMAVALILHGVAKRCEQAVRRRLTWRAGGFAFLGGAAIPSAIQYWATDGAQAWAGLLIAAVGAGLLWRSVMGPGDAEAPTAFSFREKSAAAGIVAILGVYGWSTFQVLTSSLTLETALRWLAYQLHRFDRGHGRAPCRLALMHSRRKPTNATASSAGAARAMAMGSWPSASGGR
jgi:hypothetical protein